MPSGPLQEGGHVGRTWIILIYFCSGVCTLIDEVVWVRLLKLTLGNTVYASSIVVSVFMGGLALGALLMSRYADRVRRPLRLYAGLEVCATVSALALPLLMRLADGPYRWFYARFEPSPAVLHLVQVIVSAVLLLVPAMVMGSTLPLLGRYVTSIQDRVGRFVGRLYALNTLGATTGCFLAGFVLIRTFGVMEALYIAAVINLLVALGGFMLSRRYDETSSATFEPTGVQESKRPAVREGDAPASPPPPLLLAAFFLSGLISIGYEIVWMRSVVHQMGCFTFVFSGVLTVYLLGNVIGAYIGSRLSRIVKRPAAAFGVSLCLLGVTGVFYFPWLVQVAARGLIRNVEVTGSLSPLGGSLILFLVPSILMGIGFPLALQAWSLVHRGVGHTTGVVYGANTIGAVAGGILVGFVLIPAIGAQWSITLLGLVGLWFSGSLLILSSDRNRVMAAGWAVAAVGLTVAPVLLPRDYHHRLIHVPMTELVSVEEGITTTVSVHRVTRSARDERILASAGVPIAGDEIYIRSAQQTLGHLGVLLNPNAKKVVTVGFGSGETSYCLAQHDPERLDCVEISPELVDIALSYFGHINLGDQLHDRVNMLYMDGKNYLHLTNVRYDLIMNGADVPSQPGSAPMFAREHFENAKRHLEPGGLFMTKMHLKNISHGSFDSIVGTFQEVFEHVTIWFPTTKPYVFFYLCGSTGPQMYSIEHMETELAKEKVQRVMDVLRLRNSHDVMSCYIADKNDLRRYLDQRGAYQINSDMHPYVEFHLGTHDLMEQGFFQEFVETVRTDSWRSHLDFGEMAESERAAWLERQEVVYDTATYIFNAHYKLDLYTRLVNMIRGMALMPDHPSLHEQREESLKLAINMIQLKQVDSLLGIMERVLRTEPGSESVGNLMQVLAEMALKQKEYVIAGEIIRTGLRLEPDHARWARLEGGLCAVQGQREEAIACFRRALELDPADTPSRRALEVLEAAP